jgi:hypothetical protein
MFSKALQQPEWPLGKKQQQKAANVQWMNFSLLEPVNVTEFQVTRRI